MGTLAGLWPHCRLEVSIDSLHRDFASAPSTCTAEKNAKGDPQRAVGGRCADLVGLGENSTVGRRGEVLPRENIHSGTEAILQALKKQRDLSHVAAS